MLTSANPTSSLPWHRLLFITHALGGGVEAHIQDLRALLADRVEVDVLRPAGAGAVRLQASSGEEAVLGAVAWPRLAEALQRRGYSRLHFHQVDGFAPPVLDLPAALGLPYDITLHDYLPYCPLYNLSTPQGGYCGEPDLAGCEQCVRERPHAWGLTVADWRARMAQWLAGASRVLAPSAFVAERVRAHFSGLDVTRLPHPPRADWLAAPQRQVKVLLLGGLSNIKGLGVLQRCADLARQQGAPLHFVLLGTPAEPVAEDAPFEWRGPYDDADLPQRLVNEHADVVWFPGPYPETHAYTLDVALAAGLPVVAADRGAFVERLQGRDRTWLVPADSSAERWNQALLAAAGRADIAGASPWPWPDVSAQQALRESYAQALLSPLAGQSARASASWSELAALQVVPPAEADLSLSALFDYGVACGHRQARHVLRQRLREADHDQAWADQMAQAVGLDWKTLVQQSTQAAVDLREARATEQRLLRMVAERDEDLARGRARIVEMENSTSWRISRPVRQIGAVVRGARARAGQWRRLARRGVERLPMMLRILRTEGPLALARRIRDKVSAPVHQPTRQFAPALADIGPLTLATCAANTTPRYSIVIPVYEQHRHTFNCLKSLGEHTDLSDVEVIVVDDASPSAAEQALRQVQGVRFVRNPQNLGFIGSCHHGADLARGDMLVMLNNDTQVTAGWLQALQSVFDTRADAALVGAKLVYPDGSLQEAGGILWQDGSAWNWGRGADPDRPEYNYVREADYCSGACLAIRRSDWVALEGFDRAYMPAYYEDTDLAFRVRAAGKRVYYQPLATIVHHEGISSGTDETRGVKKHQVVNQKVFFERWCDVLKAHRLNGIEPLREVDRGARARILVVEACMITPDQDSGSVRMLAMLELLMEQGFKVSFVADNLECRQPYVRQLQQAGVEVWHGPYVSSVAELLEQRGALYDVIMFCRHYIAAPYMAQVRRWAPQARIVFDTVDLHYLREQRLAELENSPSLLATSRKTREQELGVIRACDITLVTSPVEREVLATETPGADVRILSNIHDVHPEGLPFSQREGMLFIGGFRHPPNIDAVEWLLSEVWPHVLAAMPQARLTVVGSHMPDRIRALQAPGVVMAGFVEQVEPLIDAARLSLAPLRYGAGVKGKINQAMAHGLPVVATAVAAEGMNLRPGEDLLVSDDPKGFADAIVRLYDDEVLWHTLAANGRANIEQHFSRAAAARTLAGLLEPR